MFKIDCHLRKRAFSGLDDECGDTGIVRIHDHICFMALVDVLGHGPQAHEVAVRAETYLTAHYRDGLPDIVLGLHALLEGTRGAVAALCRLDMKTGVLLYTGSGNICMKRFGSSVERMPLKEGILGYRISAPRENRVTLYPGDIFVMNSDGIREYFNTYDYPTLLMGTAMDITAVIMDHLSKKTDDASCIIVRFGI
jgi:phosphoserine phosphatase RsbX